MSQLYLRCFSTPPGSPEGSTQLHGVAEFKNSHGFAPLIWSSICERYFHNGMMWMMEPQRLNLSDPGLAAITNWESVALQSTYDLAVIKAEDTKKWAEALIAFSAKHGRSDRVNWLPQIAEAALKTLEERTGVVGFCTYASQGDDLWYIREEPEEDPRAYDLNRDTGHFFIEF